MENILIIDHFSQTENTRYKLQLIYVRTSRAVHSLDITLSVNSVLQITANVWLGSNGVTNNTQQQMYAIKTWKIFITSSNITDCLYGYVSYLPRETSSLSYTILNIPCSQKDKERRGHDLHFV